MITFDKFLNQYMARNISADKFIAAISSLSPIFNKIQIDDGDKYIKVLKCFHEHICGNHFNKYFAEEQVKCMYHTNTNGTICKGEYFTFDDIEHIYNKTICRINREITIWDVYVAFNAQYHDHVLEYIEWFKTTDKVTLNNKIIEAAINFWFMDEDAGNGKVWNYFKNIG